MAAMTTATAWHAGPSSAGGCCWPAHCSICNATTPLLRAMLPCEPDAKTVTVAAASCRTQAGRLLPQGCRMWRRTSCGSAVSFQHLLNGCPQAVVGHEGGAEQRLVGQGGARHRQAAGGSRSARLVIDPACGRAGPGECNSISRRLQHTTGQGEGLRTGMGHRGDPSSVRQQGKVPWLCSCGATMRLLLDTRCLLTHPGWLHARMCAHRSP